MEGISISKEIIGLVSALGVVPSLAIIAVCFFFFTRELKKTITGLETSVSTKTAALEAQIKDLQHDYDSKDEKIMQLIEVHTKEIRAIEQTFLTREQHYRDFENWKSEISELRTEVRNLPGVIFGMIKGA